MSRTTYEGKTKVYFATSVASITAPTTANISGATNLTPFITKDGVSVPNTQNMVDSATIEEVFDAQTVGSWGGGALELTMFRDDAADTAWNLIVYRTTGFLIISRFGAPIAGSKVEVWPVQMHAPIPQATAANEMQKFTAAFAVTAAPELKATVV